MDKMVTVKLPMADRTQTQFDSSPEVKRQVKLLMIHEGIDNQAALFLGALDIVWGNKYPELRQAIIDDYKAGKLSKLDSAVASASAVKPDTSALRRLLGLDK